MSERSLFVDPAKYPALAEMVARGDGDDGSAPVREPRRPKPSAPGAVRSLGGPGVTPLEALLSFWADVDTWFSENDNPLGRGLPDEQALRVTRGGLGQIRRWVEQYRAVLHEEARDA